MGRRRRRRRWLPSLLLASQASPVTLRESRAGPKFNECRRHILAERAGTAPLNPPTPSRPLPLHTYASSSAPKDDSLQAAPLPAPVKETHYMLKEFHTLSYDLCN